jgi:hypothetical protein
MHGLLAWLGGLSASTRLLAFSTMRDLEAIYRKLRLLVVVRQVRHKRGGCLPATRAGG